MHRLRNLNIYPSLFFMDQISSQLRIIRPVAWNKTEVTSLCLGVKGESDLDRENRIRQFEDFFNVSGMERPMIWLNLKNLNADFKHAFQNGVISLVAIRTGNMVPLRIVRYSGLIL
jgi:anthranilate 1,2-dioxygenase (deaminating, decarboxylating) large subunit